MSDITVLRDEVDRRKDEMRAKFRQSGGQAFDQTEVKNPQPGKHYRGVNKDPSRVAAYKKMGYEVTPINDPAQWTVKTNTEDGAQLFGEQILMEIPLDKYVDNNARAELRQEMLEGQMADETRSKLNDIAKTGTHGRVDRDITFDDSKTEPEVVGT